jgi:hypothetical protein
VLNYKSGTAESRSVEICRIGVSTCATLQFIRFVGLSWSSHAPGSFSMRDIHVPHVPTRQISSSTSDLHAPYIGPRMCSTHPIKEKDKKKKTLVFGPSQPTWIQPCPPSPSGSLIFGLIWPFCQARIQGPIHFSHVSVQIHGPVH